MIEQSVSLASNGVVKVPGYEQLVRFGYTKNRGVYRLAVTASGEWEGLAIRCFWHVPNGKDPASSLVVDGYVDVPASVTAQPGNGCITFEGSDGTKTVTSADLRYRVSSNSGTEDGTEPEPGTPAWQQLVDAVHADATAAEQAKTDAQTAAQQAATSAGNADQSAQEAADSLQELKDGIASGDFKGEPGNDGKSPVVTVTGIENGHRVSITDKDGTKTIDVLNGQTGKTGATPVLTIGMVSSGDKPSADITGTPENPVLNLRLQPGPQGPAVALDQTLSVSGKAADAAKVGEAVNAEATRAKAAEEANAKGVSQLKEDLVDLRTSIGVFETKETVNTTTNTNGRYWTSDKTNSWGHNDNFAVTNAVAFTKGTTIIFKAYGESGVAFFVETTSPNSINQKTTGISLNFEQTSVLEGKYTFEADTPISFSYNTAKEFYVNIVKKTNKVTDYYGKVDDLENSINYIPMFRNIGIIGDSLSSGEIAYSNETGNYYVDRFDSSWLSIIGRNNGVNVLHYSQGGMTAKAWLENAGDKKANLLADESKNAYFIALGTNDISESYPLGNVSDALSTNSFVGYLKNIINVVHTKAPNAVVFLVSTYNNSVNGISYSNMISEIANLYDYCFFVDFVNHTDISTSTGGVWSNLGHFTSIGYVKVAKIIEKLLNKIVDENKNYFKFFTLNN